MLIIKGILLTAEICKKCFLPEISLIPGNKEVKYRNDYIMFNVYKSDTTRFLYTKIK